MSAEYRDQTAATPQETLVEDPIGREQKKLLQAVTACGENLFTQLQETRLVAGRLGDIEMKTAFSRDTFPPVWTAKFSFPIEGEESARRIIRWRVNTREVKRGLLSKDRIPNWDADFKVELDNFRERGLYQLILNMGQGEWWIKTDGEYPLEPPIEIKEGKLPSVDQKMFCSGNPDYSFPLSITRGIGNSRLPTLSATYAKGDGPILVPCDASLDLNIKPHLRDKPEFRSLAALEKKIDGGLQEGSELLSRLWETFPGEVNFVNILEDYRNLIVDSTNQALEDFLAARPSF